MARYPLATWKGAAEADFSRTPIQHKFIVVHVMQGTLDGTTSWFNNPASQVSAHFGIGKDGTVYQFVDTDQNAYAEAYYNNLSISIEHEGYSGEYLTALQRAAAIKLCEWIHKTHPTIPLKRQSNPSTPRGGIIGHGQLGVAGGNHPECPGDHILDGYNKMIRVFNPSLLRRLANKLSYPHQLDPEA